jgi:hypothetical protein
MSQDTAPPPPGQGPSLGPHTPRFYKLYDGTVDLLNWMNQCEQFFRGQHTPTSDRTRLVSYHLTSRLDMVLCPRAGRGHVDMGTLPRAMHFALRDSDARHEAVGACSVAIHLHGARLRRALQRGVVPCTQPLEREMCPWAISKCFGD